MSDSKCIVRGKTFICAVQSSSSAIIHFEGYANTTKVFVVNITLSGDLSRDIQTGTAS